MRRFRPKCNVACVSRHALSLNHPLNHKELIVDGVSRLVPTGSLSLQANRVVSWMARQNGASMTRPTGRARTEYKERWGSAPARRVIRALRLDPFFYVAVAKDSSLTREAVLVAVVSSLVAGLGLMLVRIVQPLWWFLGGVAWAAVVLVVGTWFVVAVGRRLGGRAGYGQMLRALGYATAPQALGFIPIANFIPGFVAGGIWTVACAIVAVRDVHDIPTRAAAALVVAPLLMVVAILPMLGILLGFNA